MGWPADFTWYKLLTDWGSLIGGVFALIAGGTAYIAGCVQARATRRAAEMQVRADERRDARDLDALRKALATELRQLVGQALAAHDSLKRLVTTATVDSPITARMVESSSRVPAAVVYPNSAPKIGLLGGSDAMDIVIIYNMIEIARTGTAGLMRSRTPDNIAPVTVAAVADAFLKTCQYAQGVLPKFRTGFALHDDKDKALIQIITDTAAAWDEIMKRWPKLDQ
jgi:hypothetical protein